MYVPWGISRVLEEGRQIPWRGRVTWWHFWSEDNKCISEYFTGTSPSLSILISHWLLFFSCHTHHYILNSGKTKAKAAYLSDIPEGQGLVSRAGDNGAGEGQELDAVDWVLVATQGVPAPLTAREENSNAAPSTQGNMIHRQLQVNAGHIVCISGKMNTDNDSSAKHCTTETATNPSPLVFASHSDEGWSRKA